jgi:ribosome-binding protein aMBF1 (putative translation factor)
MKDSKKKRPDETPAEWLKRVSIVDDSWLEKVKWRKANKGWLSKSQNIALRILRVLDEIGMDKVELAEKMGMTYEEFKPILQGKVDLNLSTVSKIEKILDTKLILTPYEEPINNHENEVE